MGVVQAEHFRWFLSRRDWSPEQKASAQEVLDGVERGLASALFGTLITPETMTETAPIMARTGQVATRFPVQAVTALNGTIVSEQVPLPTGWRIERLRLYRPPATTSVSMLGGFGAPRVVEPYRPYDGDVTLTYLAGWGAQPDLVLAIMRKAKDIWINNHDDSLTARPMSGDAPAPMPEEDWTDDELAPLGRFRRLDVP